MASKWWIVIVLVAIVAYLSIGTGAPSALFVQTVERELTEFDKVNGADFIYYNDTNNSFSIKYPIGYKADLNPDDFSYLRFSSVNPVGLSESIDVYLRDSLYSTSVFDSDARRFPADSDGGRLELMSRKSGRIGERDAYWFYLKETTTGLEPVYVTSVIVNCDGYAANVVASIPQSLLADKFVAEYMARSFRC